MIACPVCGKTNDSLRTICVSCGSFLQARVDALNLFETLWGLILTPQATLKRIVLSRYKNYAMVLSALFGIGLVFDVVWYRGLGDLFGSLLALAAIAAIVGPVVGILTVHLIGMALRYATRFFLGNSTQRNMFAVVAYAVSPFVPALIFIVPLQVAVFGMDFFGTNPPPIVIKPLEYTLLLILKSVAAVYSIYLLVEGTMAANGFGAERKLSVLVSVLAVLGVSVSTMHLIRLQ